ncbi:hypothetical protein INS49_014340 [Diaporthe citri]|uniref:uncharacterized protein n=1 Tax=Diaporthe citri TaxID=83186 RepID=UPI001C7ECD39|nr:uncharacterized protein INS49_014340 [Diaporthe citri]KAG6358456.1 hypothetical protein INS49_014340 [Diaporthe citri]
MKSKSSTSDSAVTKDAQPHASSVVRTPCPYEQGKSVDLLVTKTFTDEIDVGQLSVNVTNLYSMTVSPVTEIVYKKKFGQSFRKVPWLRQLEYLEHTVNAEEAWRGCVRDGKAEALFEEIRTNHNTLPCGPAKYFMQRRPDRKARWEGALQYNCLRFFENETRAYEKLADIQGRSIPKLVAHVRVLLEADHLNTEGTEVQSFFASMGSSWSR